MREVDTKHVFPKDPSKTYGLMELVRGTKPTVGLKDDDSVFTWPHLLMREVGLELFDEWRALPNAVLY